MSRLCRPAAQGARDVHRQYRQDPRLRADALGTDPLLAYAVVGLGAAAYSPAKYGILTEYLPHRKLVVANGWIEGLTVASIILGTVFGGVRSIRASRESCCTSTSR